MATQFFHEIDPLHFRAMKHLGATWAEVKKQYNEPTWCGYGEEALDGGAGCWSLVGRKIRCESDCKRCDAYIPQKTDASSTKI